jgi:hypothetical protein
MTQSLFSSSASKRFERKGMSSKYKRPHNWPQPGQFSTIKNYFPSLFLQKLLFYIFSQDFLESNSAISFFFEVYFHWVGHTNNIQFQTIENKQTNEKLAISGDHWRRSMCSNHVFIERYPIEATWKWINEMKKRGMTKYRHIYAGESRNYCCWQPDVV